MTIEADIFTALTGLVAGRIFPDFAPLSTTRPYIVYSKVGGEAVSYVDDTVPDKQNGHYQFNVWADTRAQASSIALSVESTLVTALTMQARPNGAPTALSEPDYKLYGSMQDFSIWSAR